MFERPRNIHPAGGRIRPVGCVAPGHRWPQRHSRSGTGGNAPSFIKGLVNQRGVIVPIVDLRQKLGLADAALDGTTMAQRVVGVVVDSVSEVLQLNAQQLRPAPEFNCAVSDNHITGIATMIQGEVQRVLALVDIEQPTPCPAPGRGLCKA